jgi:hypothetical protein
VLLIPEFVAALSSALFAGAAIYIDLVEHPGRLRCDTKTAATVWAPSDQRATLMQAPLPILSFIAGVGAWVIGGGVLWVVCGAEGVLAALFWQLTVYFPRGFCHQAHLIAGRLLDSWEPLQLAPKNEAFSPGKLGSAPLVAPVTPVARYYVLYFQDVSLCLRFSCPVVSQG